VEYAFNTFALTVVVLVAQNSPREVADARLRREKFEVLKMYKLE
jgi:glucose-6-phosphate 1-dehydrogenase